VSASTYRYMLRRTWDELGWVLVVVMLNPSTADEDNDDPTIRRCISFAKREGYGGIVVVNLYAYRATDPEDLKRVGWLEGAQNDVLLPYVLEVQRRAGERVLVAWGARAQPERVAKFREQAHGLELVSLGETRDGAPRHPLYVRRDAPMVAWPCP
jgi:hypothetical protein